MDTLPLQVTPWQVPDYAQQTAQNYKLKEMIEADQQRQIDRQKQAALSAAFSGADTSSDSGQSDLQRKLMGIDYQTGLAYQKQRQEQAFKLSEMQKNQATAAKDVSEAGKYTADMQKTQHEQTIEMMGQLSRVGDSVLATYQNDVKGGILPEKAAEKAKESFFSQVENLHSTYANNPELSKALTGMEQGGFNIATFPQELAQLKAAGTQLSQQSQSPIGKVMDDLRAGRITQKQAEDLIRKETHIAVPASMIMNGQGLSKDAIELAAEQLLSGDTSVLNGIGRGIQGASDLRQIRNRAAEMAKAQGKTGRDLAAGVAEFIGLKAGERTIGTKTANVDTTAVDIQQMKPMLVRASEKFKRTNYPDLNKALTAFATRTGDTDVIEYGAALQSYINTYARAMNSGGAATIPDKEHAEHILSASHSHEQLLANIRILDQEVAAIRRAPRIVKQDLREQFTGEKPGEEKTSEKTINFSDLK